VISFVIPAHNEQEYLARTLESVNGAARVLGLCFEILIVNDGSTDGTADVALQNGAEVHSIEVRQISAARNAGAKCTSGEMLIFLDADTVCNAAVVGAAIAAMRQGAVGGGCGFRFDGPLPLYGRVIQSLANPLYRTLRLASGCFLFCTREAFLTVGGFDESLFAAEEAAMSRELRRQGQFVVLREQVLTSGRKLRTYSAYEVLSLLFRLALSGGKALKARDGLDIWYGRRRDEP
jgi:glycosyltransferase involved in cell wall biosynthesis